MSERVALVTGGASGIGAATAARLAADGCRVVVADLNDELGAKHAADIGGRYVRFDVGDRNAWSAVVADILANEGRIDVAHLNAGVVTGEGDVTRMTDAQYDRILGANLNGVVYGVRAVGHAMAASGGGAIVCTASAAGVIAFEGDPIYTMTKHAVVGLVRSSATSLGRHGITINAVCPGIVDTGLVAPARERLIAAGLDLIPPSEIADAVVGAIQGGRSGECWVCLPGKPAYVHQFAGIDLA
jgi:NAD(P)-dependent dehydrogenase (short-subunit alcohol dehydrogenase family)